MADKLGYGAFSDTAIITGTVTQICVKERACESFHHGFKTVVLSDGVWSFDPELQRAMLKNFAMKFGMADIDLHSVDFPTLSQGETACR